MSLTPEAAAAKRDEILGELENEHKAMMAVIEHVPEDKLGYRPHEKMKTFAELAAHIYGSGVFLAKIAALGKVDPALMEDPPTPKTKASLIEACNRLNHEARSTLTDIPAKALTKEIDFFGSGSYPAVQFAKWHFVHLIHHRGQLTIYLRTMGAKVPPIYGPTTDYPSM